MATFYEIINQCWQTAEDTGWHDNPFNWENRIGNIHSELSEAFDAHRKGGQEPTKTWWSKTLRSHTDQKKQMFIAGQPNRVIETLEWDRMPIHVDRPKPEGVPSEFADVAIWFFDACQIRNIPIESVMHNQVTPVETLSTKSLSEVIEWSAVFANKLRWFEKMAHFQTDINILHSDLALIQTFDVEDTDNILHQQLARFIWRLFFMCHRFNIDLETAILEKLEYNKGREYRHGHLPY